MVRVLILMALFGLLSTVDITLLTTRGENFISGAGNMVRAFLEAFMMPTGIL